MDQPEPRFNRLLSRLHRLWWLIPVALTFGLYHRVLSLPLYWDDAPHFYFTVPHTWWQIWTNHTGYAYYRPLIFTFYKLAFQTLVPDGIFLAYGTSLAVHAINSVLVGKLAASLLRAAQKPAAARRAFPVSPTLAGALASVAFVVYPFSIYAIGNFAALMHPAVVCLTLIGMLAACRFIRNPARRWLAVILLVTALAPYFHESGVMVSAILVWAFLCLDGRVLRRHRWLPVILFALSSVFLVFWWLVPKTGDKVTWPSPAIAFQNLTFFLQGLTFPVQPLATLLIVRFQWNELAAVWLVGLPPLLGLAAVFRRSGRFRLYLLCVGWAALAALPTVLVLPFWYVLTGPRLLYALAPAAILLWTVGCLAVIGRVRRPWIRALVAGGAALLILAPALWFSAHKIQLYRLSLAPLTQMAHQAQRAPRERHLIINPADWVADVRDLYPLGRWGVSVMPDYVQMDRLMRINTGLPIRIDNVQFPPIQTAMAKHYYQINGPTVDWRQLAGLVPDYDRVWLTTYADDRIAVEEAGTVRQGAPAAPDDYRASFEGLVFLLDGRYGVEGREAVVTLDWKYLGPNPEATVFRHVLDCAGNVLGMGDGFVLDRTVQFSDLTPGAEIHDVRRIPLDALAADGCYAVQVGLFRADGSRVTATAPDGTAFENAAVTIRQRPDNP